MAKHLHTARRRDAYPHSGVSVRLKSSRRHGIGVFAIRDIPKGTAVFGEDGAETRRVPAAAVSRLPREIQRLYEDFCPLAAGFYTCPSSFNDLTVSWYLNHSARPNVACDSDLRFWTIRRVRKGEELTADYSKYSETRPVRSRRSSH